MMRRSSSNRREVLDLTDIGIGGSIIDYDNYDNNPNLFCEYCSVKLIKKMDDIKLLNTEEKNVQLICPHCGNFKDPLNLDGGLDKLRRSEKGQTIRSNNNSSSSSDGVGEGIPFAEMFSTNNTATTGGDNNNNKGTLLNRSLQNVNDPEPNEEANLRGQNMRIVKTTTEYPESGRRVVKTFDE
jgi:hypothetical protein